MGVNFTDKGWEQLGFWQDNDTKTVKKIRDLIKSIQRDGFMDGLGHPEQLKRENAYSRKIDKKNRLVYEGEDNRNFSIISCKGHYDDK